MFGYLLFLFGTKYFIIYKIKVSKIYKPNILKYSSKIENHAVNSEITLQLRK